MAEMTNDELRTKIAEKKYRHVELHLCSRDQDSGEWIDIQGIELYGNESPNDKELPCYEMGERGYEYWEVCPDYPRSIAAAWELVEEMPNPIIEKLWKNDTAYYKVLPNEYYDQMTIFAEADTAPRAICLAWLVWKEK